VLAQVHRVSEHVRTTASLPWEEAGWLTLDDRREDFQRVLRLEPVVRDLTHYDAHGVPDMHVSRLEAAALPGPASHWFSNTHVPRWPDGLPPPTGSVEYLNDYEPHLLLTVPDPHMGAGVTVARINLRSVAGDLQDALHNAGLEAYALDRQGRIVLHADPALMLARQPLWGTADLVALDAPASVHRGSVDGSAMLASAIALPELGWRLVVEQPRAAVLAPIVDTLWRTALVTLLGVASVGCLALVLVGRSSRPIEALHQGAQDLAAGRLNTRIHIHTDDELEDLATQFNTMAASLEELYNDMAGIIDVRTRELRQANQHKSEFLTHMSHELRTPLNSVIGFSDLLREEIFGPLNDKQREYANDIHASGEHLLALINDVLDLSKIEAGHMAAEWAEADIPPLLQSLLAMMRERCLRAGLALKQEIAPEVQTWEVDPRRFKQIVINLLSNAVKFTPSGGAVTLRAGLDEAQGLWVEVADTGVGIAPDHQAAVFEEFRQVGNDPLTAAQGTGLGLALVRRLVRLQGGEVRLTSEPGQGSTFHFNIPKQAPT